MVKDKPTIALFGGSFDPPHKGHQTIVQSVAALDDIAYIIVMPAFLNPFKISSLASAQKRLIWCRKVCHGDKVIVSDFEISQARPVYTIETLRMLQQTYNVKYVVIGADNLPKIAQWEAFEEINAEVIWLVATRGETAVDCRQLRQYKQITLDVPVSSSSIRRGEHLHAVDHRILNEVKQHIYNTKDTHDNQRES